MQTRNNLQSQKAIWSEDMKMNKIICFLQRLSAAIRPNPYGYVERVPHPTRDSKQVSRRITKPDGDRGKKHENE